MSICLSHKSADLFLEHLAHEGKDLDNVLEPASGAIARGLTANATDTRELLGDSWSAYLPLDILVSKPALRRGSAEVNAHLWAGPLPDGSIKRYSEGLYVVSPEFCLLLQAHELHLVNLCQMLGRFLATASPLVRADTEKKLESRSPLTTLSRLEDFLAQMPSTSGTRRLREAMRYTLPGAASPQETNLQLAFALPYAYYGFGFKHLELNHCVELSGEARSLHEAEHIYVDLYFGKPRARKDRDASALRAFGLEYQGEDSHQDPSRDASRFLAAHAEGVDLWYVANDQLKSPDQLDYIAREAALRIGKKINPLTWPTRADLGALLDILNGKTIPHPTGHQRKMTGRTRKPPTKNASAA